MWLVAALVLLAGSLNASVSSAAAPSLRGAELRSGQLVPEGRNYIVTSEPATLGLENGAEVGVAPGTKFRLGKTVKLPLRFGKDPLVPTRVIILSRGRVDVAMPKTERLRFAVMVQGPRGVVGINQGGRTTVVVTDERVAVASHVGVHLFSTGKGWRRLREGKSRFVSDYYPHGQERRMVRRVDSPQSSRRLLRALGGPDSATVLTWPKLPRAASYELSLENGDGSSKSLSVAEPSATVGELAAGRYSIRLRGLDSMGIEGAWSEPTVLNVVGFDVPVTAAITSDGVFRLQPGQRVRLLGARGLEISYNGMDSFLPAPRSLGLVARRPIKAVLRHPHSNERVGLELVPMNVRAEVSFESHPEGWPEGGIRIAVQLRDESGLPVPASYAAEVRTTINVESAALGWRRAPGRMVARLPRPSTPGPWVIRVAVFNETGVLIGRDFTEVGYAADSRAGLAAPTKRR